jgi:hypothetical protein
MQKKMKNLSLSSLAAILLPLAITRTSAPIIETSSEKKNDWKCSLYLAESIIPGAGLGAFTIREYEQGDEL